MNLPLQPIDTAPRDGSEVLLYFRSGVSGRRKCIAEWDSASERWSLCGISLTDAAFSGWLDVEALARDSERLTKLIDRFNFSDAETISDLFDDAYEIAAHASGNTEDYQWWVRAAIDKEVSRG